MAESEKEKKKLVTIDENHLTEQDNAEGLINQLSLSIGTVSTDVLMPELEELVKKNPNRLIGCGG